MGSLQFTILVPSATKPYTKPLAFLIREIQISVQALEHHISDIENN